MSGIVGSKFNIRGSGLVGSLGTDGQHMLSAGAGKTNVFETIAAAGGAWNKIITQTITSTTASMDFVDGVGDCVFDNTYRRYCCIFDDYLPSDDTGHLKIRMRQSDSFVTTGYIYSMIALYGGSVGTYSATDTALIIDHVGNAADETVMGEIWFQNPSNANTKPLCHGTLCFVHGSDSHNHLYAGCGGINTTGAIDGFQFSPTAGDIENLQATLYGITT